MGVSLWKLSHGSMSNNQFYWFFIYNHCAYKVDTICFGNDNTFNKRGFPESLPVKFISSVGL